jgi:hypothetical protein
MPTPEEFQQIFNSLRKRANAGDQRARAALIKYMDRRPERWAAFGDMARHAEMSLIETIAQGEWLAGEAITRDAARLRERLSRPNQSPLEELAVSRLVACWVQLQFVESMCHRAEIGGERGKFWLQRQQQAHRLYSQAEKSLLLIRGALVAPALPGRLTDSGAVTTPAQTAAPAASQPVDGSPHEPPVPQFNGENRIGHLFAGSGDGLTPDASHMEPVNGHRHRLNGFLSPVFDG